MKIRPSSALRNEYTQISELAKASGEPIFITNKGEDDGVFMSMAAYEDREKMFRHRDKIYAAELSRAVPCLRKVNWSIFLLLNMTSRRL